MTTQDLRQRRIQALGVLTAIALPLYLVTPLPQILEGIPTPDPLISIPLKAIRTQDQATATLGQSMSTPAIRTATHGLIRLEGQALIRQVLMARIPIR